LDDPNVIPGSVFTEEEKETSQQKTERIPETIAEKPIADNNTEVRSEEPIADHEEEEENTPNSIPFPLEEQNMSGRRPGLCDQLPNPEPNTRCGFRNRSPLTKGF
jgi:hypothetical protein